MALDVSSLLELGPEIHEVFQPNADLYTISPPSNRTFAELSLLSSRREFWEPFACLVGFAQQVRTNPHTVLLRLPFHSYFSRPPRPEADPFLEFARPYISDWGMFFSGSYTLRLLFDEQNPFVLSVSSVEKLQECFRSCKSASDKRACVIRCMSD
jgi:hypothetical protein